MYTAVYARVSTGMQAVEGTSLESQVELCVKKAKELNTPSNQIRVYREEGFSGEEIDRPEMNQLRQDIGAGLISQVIITHPDRLSRDLTDKLFVCREFESKHVSLVFVDTEYRNTPEGQLFFNLISVIAQYELSLIKKRTIRGRLKAVEKDKKIMPMRVPPFGYDLVNSQLIVNEAESKFVELIYQWYTYDQLTMREIGNKLVEMGAEPKRAENKNWSASSIQKILINEVYIGKYYYNRRSTQKLKGERTKTGAPKKTYTIRDEKEWILVEVPSIIDEQIFKLAQEQRLKNTIKSGHVKNEYLLKSLLRCGNCGRKWAATTYSGRYNKVTCRREKYKCYRCPNLFPKTYGKNVKACPSRSIRADVLDDYVWGLIMEVISDPQDYIDRMTVNKDSVIYELSLVAETLKKQIAQKEKEADKIKTMFKRELIDEQEMETEFRAIRVEENELKIRYESCSEQLRVLKEEATSIDINKNVFNKISNFMETKGKELSFDDKRYVVETLIDELLIRFQDTQIQVTATGYLDELRSSQQINSVSKSQPTLIVGKINRSKK